MAVTGIIARRRHGAGDVRLFVLADEEIEISIAVHVPAGERHGMPEFARCGPCQEPGRVEPTADRSPEQPQAFMTQAEEVHDTITVKVRHQSGVQQSRILTGQRFGAKLAIPSQTPDLVPAGEHHLGTSVAIQILDDQWVHGDGVDGRFDLLFQPGNKRRKPVPNGEADPAGVETPDTDPLARGPYRVPMNRQITSRAARAMRKPFVRCAVKVKTLCPGAPLASGSKSTCRTSV